MADLRPYRVTANHQSLLVLPHSPDPLPVGLAYLIRFWPNCLRWTRAVFVANLADERSDDEGEDEAVDAAAKSKGKGRKAE